MNTDSSFAPDRRASAFIGGLLSLLTASTAIAQNPAVFHAGTRLVEVDVVVRDKNGPVTGLTKDDFTVFDCKESQPDNIVLRNQQAVLGPEQPCKGKRQPIQIFHAAGGATPLADAPALPLAPGAISNRLNSGGQAIAGATVVLIDQLNTNFDYKGYLRVQTAKFLQTLSGGDRFALYSLGQNLHVLQDFTDDPKKLIDAVTRADSGDRFFSLYEGEPSLGNAPGEDKLAGVEAQVMADVYADVTVAAIQKLVQHLAGVPGRKNLIWIKQTPSLGSNLKSSAKIRALLRDANIALYPVMVRTLGSSGVFGGRPTPTLMLQNAARDLGASLGGAGFGDVGYLKEAVQRAEEDTNSAYTLGFYPEERDLDGKVHQLTVALSRKASANAKLEMRYRTEYLATPNAPATAEAPGSFEDVFNSPLNATAIGLAAVAKPDPARPGDFNVEVTVNLADVQLAQQGGLWSGSLKLAARLEWKTPDGLRIAQPVIQPVAIDLTQEQLQAMRGSGFTIRVPVGAGGRPGSLRLIIQDQANGAVGSLRVPLEGIQPEEGI